MRWDKSKWDEMTYCFQPLLQLLLLLPSHCWRSSFAFLPWPRRQSMPRLHHNQTCTCMYNKSIHRVSYLNSVSMSTTIVCIAHRACCCTGWCVRVYHFLRRSQVQKSIEISWLNVCSTIIECVEWGSDSLADREACEARHSAGSSSTAHTVPSQGHLAQICSKLVFVYATFYNSVSTN